MAKQLLIFGKGYTGTAIAAAAVACGWTVSMVSRREVSLPGVLGVPFGAAEAAIATTDALLTTSGPAEIGDPVLLRYRDAIGKASGLRWIGVLSSISVYGDRGGATVHEASVPRPESPRALRRLDAEQGWAEVANGRSLDLFRLAGIYGPGRSVFDELRAGEAHRVSKPGHLFNRIHRDDIALAVMVALGNPPVGRRVLHGSDSCPAEQAAVVEEAASLLGVAPPPLVPFAQAKLSMTPKARSFWNESRRVDSSRTLQALGISWRYPSYREGLRAILAAERPSPGGRR